MDPGSLSLSLAGGLLIGFAAAVLLACNGRIAGVSRIASGLLLGRRGEGSWRLLFVLGLVAGGAAYAGLADATPPARTGFPSALLAIAGVLVGFGTSLGSGCTSGHGVCGLGRGSIRSLVATLVCLAAAIATTFVVRHAFGVL